MKYIKYPSLKVFLLLAGFSFFSCKKNSVDDYYVKLKINGNWVTWKTVAVGQIGPDQGNPAKTEFRVTSADDAAMDNFTISVEVDGANFITGIYPSDTTVYLVRISYYKGVTTAISKFFDIENAPARPVSKYKVNISSITNTGMKGSFSGNYLYDDFKDESLDVTEGEFFAKRVQ